MKAEDAEAIFNCNYPHRYLSVGTDHLDLKTISFIGRVLRWFRIRHEDTRIDKVAEYICNNYEEWSKYPTDHQPCTAIYKRLKNVNTRYPGKISESFKKIKDIYRSKIKISLNSNQTKAWSPPKRDISKMTVEEIFANLGSFTFSEISSLPNETLYKIIFRIIKQSFMS